MDWVERGKLRAKQWEAMWADYAREGLFPIELWKDASPEFPHNDGFLGRLLLLPKQEKPRGMIIVCAGGAFVFKSFNEARPVAAFFHDAGLNAAVLDYNVDPTGGLMADDPVRVQLAACEDALRAIRYVRAHADELNVPADKIAIGGFSAGGMTSALAATRYDAGNPESKDVLNRVSSRPDAALLFYGAFSSTASYASQPGYDAALQKAKAATDPIVNLRPDSPPFFIFQTHGDDPRIGLSFGAELASRGIPFEVHTFVDGPHGGGLYNGKDDTPDIPHTSRWAGLAAEWLEVQGF